MKHILAILLFSASAFADTFEPASAVDSSSLRWVRLPSVLGGQSLLAITQGSEGNVLLLQCDRFRDNHQFCSRITVDNLVQICNEFIKGEIALSVIAKGISTAVLMQMGGGPIMGLTKRMAKSLLNDVIPNLQHQGYLPKGIALTNEDFYELISSFQKQFADRCPLQFDIYQQLNQAYRTTALIMDGAGTLHDPVPYTVMMES